MMITHFIAWLCLFLPAFDQATDNANKLPNILVIIADDCTFSDLPLYGGKNVNTPNIDRLASEGMTFDKAYVSMAMCTPSRAELFTGLSPVRSGVCWNHVKARKGTKSMVHHFNKLGYRTGIAGKVHVSPKEVFPFEYVEGIEGRSVSETAGFDLDGVSGFINRDPDQPFSLISALVVPHIPWTVGDTSQFDPKALELPPYLADTPETRQELTEYLAEIRVMDDQVGKILDALERSGKAGNTIVIFTSEQGAQFPFCKWTNWDMGVHTGFIVRWPGQVKPGSRTDALIQYNDVLPTLLDALGGEYDESDFDGSSFLPVLKGQAPGHRDYAYFMHNNTPEGPPYPIRSVTDGTYHYIRNLKHEDLYIEKHIMAKMPFNQYWHSWMFTAAKNEHSQHLINTYMSRPAEQLYDLSLDPFELNDLAGSNEHASKRQELSSELDTWMKKQGDPGEILDTWEQYQSAKKGIHFKRGFD